jgi:hypothetical protein
MSRHIRDLSRLGWATARSITQCKKEIYQSACAISASNPTPLSPAPAAARPWHDSERGAHIPGLLTRCLRPAHLIARVACSLVSDHTPALRARDDVLHPCFLARPPVPSAGNCLAQPVRTPFLRAGNANFSSFTRSRIHDITRIH